MSDVYWTHNTAYHKWILKHVSLNDRVLDVGCGDGLLVQKLSKVCKHVTGIEPHIPSAEIAQRRVDDIENANIESISFEEYSANSGPFDVIIFVASLHHMDLEFCINKAKGLLTSGGKLLIVGCAKPDGLIDLCIECLRVIPAKLGSLMHGERNGGHIGVPIQRPNLSLRQIHSITEIHLPNAKIHIGLYYRYLLLWIK